MTDLHSRLSDRGLYGHVARGLMLAVLLWSLAFVHPLKAVTYTFGTGRDVPVATGIYNFDGTSFMYDGLTFGGDTQILADPVGQWLVLETTSLTISSGLSYNVTLEGSVALRRNLTWTNDGVGTLGLGSTSFLEMNNNALTIAGSGNTVLGGYFDGAGSGAIVKTGSGNLILTGSFATAVSLNISSGTVRTMSGTNDVPGHPPAKETTGYDNFTNAQSLTIGSGATLDLGGGVGTGTASIGALSLASGGTIGLTWGSKIVASGAATLSGGSFNLSLTGTPTAGQTYTLLQGGGGSSLNGGSYTLSNAIAFPYTWTITSGSVRLNIGQASLYWTGGLAGGSPKVWSAANWATDSAGASPTPTTPSSIYNLYLSASNASASNQTGMTLGADMSVMGINVTSTNPSTLTDVGGYTLTIGGTGISVASGAGAFTIDPAILLSADQTWTQSGAGALTVANVDNAVYSLTVGGTSNTVVTGTLSGAGALTKTGSGKLTLSGSSTYTGVTTVSVGTLNIQNATALGTVAGGVTVAAGAALQLQGGIAVGAEALALSGTGATSTDGALRNISGTNSYAGAVTLGAASRINSDAGALTLSGAITATNLNLTVGGAGDTTLSGALGLGTGTLTKDGVGTLTLSNANTYTGLTTVSAGTLNIQNATALGTTAGGVTVASGAALQLQGGIAVGAEALTLNGTGASTGGALRSISGTNSYAGVVTLGSASRINADAGALTLSGGITAANFNLSIGGAGDTTLSGIVGLGSGALTKDGTGKLTLTGESTYTGLTTISGGSLQIGDGASTGSLYASRASSGGIVNNGMLVFNRSDTIIQGSAFPKYLTGSGGILQLGTGTVELNGKFTEQIDGGVTYRTILGNVSVAAGTLQYDQRGESFYPVDLSDPLQLPVQRGRLAGSLNVASGATFKVIGSDLPTWLTLKGAVSGAGRIEVGDNAQVQLTGDASAFTGGFSLSSVGNYAELELLPNSSSGIALASIFNAPVVLNDTASDLKLSPIGADITVAGTISGSGSVFTNSMSNGVAWLTGSNSYTGSTTVESGTLDASAGALASTESIRVSGGSLKAVNFNPSAGLSIEAGGMAVVSGSGLSLGEINNASTASVGLLFSSASGTITLGSLTGTGVTAFGSNATITWVEQGTLNVTGLLTANIRNGEVVSMIDDGDGGLEPEMVPDGDGEFIQRMIKFSPVITAASVVSGTIAGGSLTLNGVGRTTTVDLLSGGTVKLNAGTLSVVSSGVSGGSASVSVANGTRLNFTSVSPGTLNVAALTLSSGGTIGMAWGSKIVASGSATLAGGEFKFSLSGNYTVGQTYTLLQGAPSSSLNTGSYGILNGKAGRNFTFSVADDFVKVTPEARLLYWKGGFPSNAKRWDDLNWTIDAAGTIDAEDTPTANDIAVFSADTAAAANQLGMYMGQNISLLGISVNTTQPLSLMEIEGEILTLGTGGISLSTGAGAFSIAPSVVLAAHQTWDQNGAGVLTAANVETGVYTLTVGGTSNTLVTGSISGVGALTKTGAGKLTLTGASTYSGLTTISGGSLQIGDGGTTGKLFASTASSGGIVNNGMLVFNRSDTIIQGIDFPRYLTGSGGILKLGTGTVELNGKFTQETDAGGTYRTILGDVSVAAGTLQYDQRDVDFFDFDYSEYPSQSGRVAGSLNIASGATFKVIGSGLSTSLTLKGAVSGAGRIEVGNNAHVQVTGDASAFTGGFSLSSSGNYAELELLPNSSSGSPQASIFNAPVILNDAASSLELSPIGADITVAGTISGSGSVFTNSSANGVAWLTGSNSYTGSTTVESGTLDASAGALASTESIRVSGGSLRAVNFNPSAGLSIEAGGIAAVSGSGLSLGEINNASTASVGLSFTAGSGTIALGSLTGIGVTAFGSNATVTGWVDQGTLSVAGLLTANIRNGVASTGGEGEFEFEDGPPALIPVVPVIAAASVVSGTISGGSLTLNGVGRASTVDLLSGGTVNLNAGTLSVASSGVSGGSASVSVANGTRLNFTPVSAGTLNLEKLTLSSGGTIGMVWGSKIVASGVATLSGGTFKLSLSGSPTPGQTYTLIEGGEGSLLNAGTYSLLAGGGAGNTWNITSSLVQITIGSLQTGFYWVGGSAAGAGKVWSATNWGTDVSGATIGAQSPTSNYLVYLSANNAGAANQIGMTLGANVDVLGISVTTANPATLVDDGYTLSVGSSGISMASGVSSFSIGSAMALAADQSWTNSGAGTFTVSGSINNSGHALELGGSGATVLSGVIRGAGGISKVGAGSLSLTGTNTYTGPTSVSAGLVTAARGAFGSTSSLTITGGTVLAVDLNASAPLSVAAGAVARFSGSNLDLGTVSNSGKLEFLSLVGVGSLSVLAGAATGETIFRSNAVVSSLSTQGLTHVAGGTLTVRDTVGSVGGFTVASGAWARFEKTASLGAVLANGLVTVKSNSYIDRLSGSGVVNSTGVLALGGGNYSGALQVPSTLIKQGPGTLYLGSSGHSIPVTQVEAGSMLLSATNVLATSGTLLVKGAATFGVITGGSQTLQKVVIENGATIGIEGYAGELLAYDMTLGSGTYLMTPVRLRVGAITTAALDNSGVEGTTLGESKVLQGLGRDLGGSRGNSFEKFTFNLDGQSPGSIAQLGGTAYTDALVLTAATGGTMRLQGDANIRHVKTLIVGDAGSSNVKLEMGAYNGGTLKIGGDSISAPISQVLKGNGTIIGDIIIGAGAVVKPGNSPGPLNFVGNVFAMPGSELQFEYTANAQTTPGSGPHDTIAITGSLRAKGGIVAVAYDPNGKPRVTDFKKHTFTIMTYTVGTVSDVNGSVPSYMNVGGTLRQSPMILASVSSGTVGLIQMTIQRRQFSSLGDGNVKKIGALLDSKLSLSDGPISNFIDILDSQSSLSAVRELLSSGNPGASSELPNVTFGRLKGLQIGLSGHLSALALGSLYGPSPSEKGLNLWSTTYGTWQRLNADLEMGSPGYSGSHYGNVSGVERKTGGLTLGVSAAMGGSSVNFGDNLGSLIAETWHGGAYASVLLGNVAFDAAASFGAGDNTLNRASGLNSQQVKFRNTEWLTQVGLSVALNPSFFVLTPSVHLVSFGYSQKGFSEGAGGLLETKVVGNSYIRNALQTGLQAARLFAIKGHAVRLSASANWMHYLDSRRHTTDAMLGGMSDAPITMQSSKVGADSIQFGAAAEMALTRRTTLRLNAQSELQSNQKTTNGNATLSVEF